MKSSCLQTFVVLVLAHVFIEALQSHFGITTSFLNKVDSEDCKHEDYEDACPSLLRGEELALSGETDERDLVVFIEYVEKTLHNNRYNGHVNGQLQESALEQHVEISVNSAMSAPVLHVQFVKQDFKGGVED